MARDGKPDNEDGIPHIRKEPRPDFSKLPPREKLPEGLQKMVDDEETLASQIYDGTAGETTESNLRYAAYATRIRTILLSAQRYVAYTSDIGIFSRQNSSRYGNNRAGESFRPIAHPYLVKGAYGISWAYLAGDVSHEGYKAYLKNQRVLHPGEPGSGLAEKPDGHGHTASLAEIAKSPSTPQMGHVPALEDYRTVMAQRAVFQGIASMGLPAFTIHSIVRYSGRALKNAKNTRIRAYGPIGLGLAAVPFLPFLFDKPVEEAVEWTFHKAFATVGGKDAVGNTPATRREDQLNQQTRKGAEKEKEL
ncbi:MAG: hypothetical protein M1812_003072 [Candelaria pacifica]|nr:MAG: hypothetical protein M1812_003072 [Candelaria pacifica]